MNFLTMRSLFLLNLTCCYAGPVRSPRTSAVKLREILTNIQGVARNDQPSLIEDYLIPIEENNEDLADTTNEPFVDVRESTIQDFGVEEPEMVTDTLTDFYLPGVSGRTEQPALPLDANVIHSDLLNSGFIKSAIPSDVQELTQKLEEPQSVGVVGEQEPVTDHLVPHVLPIEITDLYNLQSVAAPSDPAELPLMYPLVRVPTAPSATFADLPLETILPSTAEKVEISFSPEALYHSAVTSGPEQWISVDALPLGLAQTTSSSLIIDSQIIQVDQPKCHSNISYELITTDNPNGKESNSSGLPFGSHHPKLRQLRFPPVSNTKENFGVQINWDEFM